MTRDPAGMQQKSAIAGSSALGETRDHIKDIEFSGEGIRRRRAAGGEDPLCVPELGAQRGEFDQMKALNRGVISEGR